jgi:hypothetical protein
VESPTGSATEASRAVGEDDSDCRGGVAVCESLPSWRAERRCRGSIPRPALCVGCEELAVLTLCELQPGAENGRSSVQSVEREEGSVRGEVPGTGHGAGWGSDADKRAGRVRTPSTSRT